jgi:hypothetical protein
LSFDRKETEWNMALPATIIRVVGTPQMVFTNPLMTIHVIRTINRPSMSSMVVGGYKNVDATNPRGGYQKPYIVIALIIDHVNGQYVRPNKVVLKYPNSKNDVETNVHFKVFNFVIKQIQRLLKYNIRLVL